MRQMRMVWSAHCHRWEHRSVGMFDNYEPLPPIACPVCGSPSVGWQGKDGPCALFLWRQGEPHAVDQPIDGDAGIERSRFADFSLPPEFAMLGRCANGHQYQAAGRAPEGVWTESELL